MRASAAHLGSWRLCHPPLSTPITVLPPFLPPAPPQAVLVLLQSSSLYFYLSLAIHHYSIVHKSKISQYQSPFFLTNLVITQSLSSRFHLVADGKTSLVFQPRKDNPVLMPCGLPGPILHTSLTLHPLVHTLAQPGPALQKEKSVFLFLLNFINSKEDLGG